MKKADYIKLYNEVINHPDVKTIEYSITDSYVHDLTPLFGVKEVLANFFDANGKDFDMNYQNGALLLNDNNSGVQIKYMIIGNSGSREDKEKIGKFGEGFKIGALSIIREGNRFLIETVGYTIVFYMERSELLNSNVMYAKYIPNEKTEGTTTYIECDKRTYENAKKMFLFLNKYEEINSFIMKTNSKNKSIYLNGLEHMKKTAVFSYNLKEKNEMSNRDRNFIAQDLLETQLIKIYNNIFDSEEIKEIISGFMDYEGKFDKTIEAKVINRLNLCEEQKEMYKSSLDNSLWYTTDIKKVDKSFKEQNQVMQVSEQLFAFLSSINANVILNDEIGLLSTNNKNIVSTFIFNMKSLPDLLELENGTASILGTKSVIKEVEKDLSIFEISGITAHDSIRKTINELSLSQRVYKGISNDRDLSRYLINNLVYLSCYPEFDIKIIEDNGETFKFHSYASDGKYYVLIKKENNTKSYKKDTLILKRKMHFEGPYFIENETFIYLANIRLIATSSIASYRVETNNHGYGFQYNTREELSRIINSAAYKDKKYVDTLIKSLNIELMEYEHIHKTLSDSMKKHLLKSFNKYYPKHSISLKDSADYDELVKDIYGYQVIKLSLNKFACWLTANGIPSSKFIFEMKQNESIETINATEEFNKAISIFKEAYDVDVPIKLAILLPDLEDSTNRNGIIYISKEATQIPEFIASLIGYEYVKMKKEFSSPSQELQSELTHNLLTF